LIEPFLMCSVQKWCQRHYAGAIFRAPENDVEELTLALRLAVTAPTDAKADLVLEEQLGQFDVISQPETEEALATLLELMAPGWPSLLWPAPHACSGAPTHPTVTIWRSGITSSRSSASNITEVFV